MVVQRIIHLSDVLVENEKVFSEGQIWHNNVEAKHFKTVQNGSISLDLISRYSVVGNTGFFLHGNRGGYNLLTCDVKLLAVTYHYFNGTYTMITSSASDLPQARRVSDESWAVSFHVPPVIEGVGLYSGDYADVFAS
ncbi:hypothetical protein B0H17DRAFT_1143794 [Mycena rosella]|uniref:Uncharacterized protein n=1 Tax=Mycena rosella TaxID=1033263 RepID=A0AAD7CUX2_MYCRO|nr:hypothetical protein B0H17DRAFT_1143794 [Mycena rosella]